MPFWWEKLVCYAVGIPDVVTGGWPTVRGERMAAVLLSECGQPLQGDGRVFVG